MLMVFGSLNVDLLFQVEALPRPGETVLCPGHTQAPGGKGANQAAAAAKAGADVRMVGQVGNDDFGRLATAALEAAGVDGSGIALSTQATGIAVIGIDATAENQIIVASGANLNTHAGQVADADLGPGVTVLCQNEVRSEETLALIQRAHRLGARTILNLAPASPMPSEVLDALDVLVVNEIEAEMAAGTGQLEADPARDSATTARTLARRHDLTCIVTLGAAGSVLMTPTGGHRVGALPIDPVDTTGAGDTFVGVLAASLDEGASPEDALRRATVAAGLACTEVGAQTSQPTAAAIAAGLETLVTTRSSR